MAESIGESFFVAIARTNSSTKVPLDSPGSRIISLEEVSWHDKQTDCWVVIYDRVYDVTNFLEEHPGGADVLLEHAGRDATLAFRGSGHSRQAERLLHKFLVGELPEEQKIFRKSEGFRLSGMPD